MSDSRLFFVIVYKVRTALTHGYITTLVSTQLTEVNGAKRVGRSRKLAQESNYEMAEEANSLE